MTIVAFLLARIAEDEASVDHARTTGSRPYTVDHVLRDAQSKRRLIRMHAGGDRYRCPVCFAPDATGELVQQLVPCQTLRLLAQTYGNHPDYRGEWCPLELPDHRVESRA